MYPFRYETRGDSLYWITPDNPVGIKSPTALAVLYDRDGYVLLRHGPSEQIVDELKEMKAALAAFPFTTTIHPDILFVDGSVPYQIEQLNRMISTSGWLREVCESNLLRLQ